MCGYSAGDTRWSVGVHIWGQMRPGTEDFHPIWASAQNSVDRSREEDGEGLNGMLYTMTRMCKVIIWGIEGYLMSEGRGKG